MNFAFTEEQEELREMARGFLAETSSSEQVRAAMTSDLGFDPEVWKRIGAELGWTAITIPDAYGGLGLSAVELTALMEVMGGALLCSPFLATVCLAADAILAIGSEDQKQALLPAIAEGQSRATLALSGPSGRWDASGIETIAAPEADGFRINGSQRFVLDGHSAELLLVGARREGTQGEEGVSLFAVPGDTAGLSREPLPTMDQTRRLAVVELQDVRVPASALLGEEGQAWPALAGTLDRAAVALAAEQVGGAQRCLDASVEYALERVQFGRTIASFQAIKHKCADMMVAVESARSAAYYAACVAAEDGEALPMAASLAKATCSEAFFRCAADSLQIHGGVGFTWEYDVHLFFKRARSMEGFLGDPAWHRERVASRLMEDPR